MASVNRFICDICKQEKHSGTWDSEPVRLDLTVYCPCSNPMGKYGSSFQRAVIRYDETCNECRKDIAQAITDTLDRLVPRSK